MRAMASVTIAATYGAGGSVVAPAVARRLGLHLIERAIPVSLAQKLAHTREVVLAEDERREGPQATRLLARAISTSGLFVGVPLPHTELGLDERVAATEQALRRVADAEGAVILGRAGVFVLAGREDTLHVRLDGRPEARLRQAIRHEGIDEATAARQQAETDRARAAYVRHFHPGLRWEDPAHYHLWLDSTVISLDACVDLVVGAARDLFGSS
jgi:cytidylate kinase